MQKSGLVQRAEDTHGEDLEELVDAVLWASRAMVGIAARSLSGYAEHVTLPQYRALVEVAMRGYLGASELATAIGVSPSTVTRMCDRLERKGLLRRDHFSGNRRSIRLSVTTAGREVVEEVTGRRREEVAEIVRKLPSEQRQAAVTTLRSLAQAAGQAPQQDWTLGWGLIDETGGMDTGGDRDEVSGSHE